MFYSCQVPHFMIVSIPYINLLNLSWITKCLCFFFFFFFFFMKYGDFKTLHNLYLRLIHDNIWSKINFPCLSDVDLSVRMIRDIWATISENLSSDICAQRRFRSDCVFAKSDQLIYWPYFGQPITKTYLYNFDPLKPLVYIVKLHGVYRGLHYYFYFCSKT